VDAGGFGGAASPLNQSRWNLDRGDSVCTGLKRINDGEGKVKESYSIDGKIWLLSDIGCFVSKRSRF